MGKHFEIPYRCLSRKTKHRIAVKMGLPTQVLQQSRIDSSKLRRKS